MKKFLSITYTNGAFNLAMFILRVGLGLLMIPHGYDKLVHFTKYSHNFMNFIGLGSNVSLALVVFAEFFCSIFLVMGLFSRLVVVPLIIDVSVALFIAHKADFFGDGEHAALYLCGFIALLLCGPGKASLDGMMK